MVEVLPNLWVVTGTFAMDRLGLIAFPRNMAILRQGRVLTLINSVRLDADGERALTALGEVRHLVRLGAFHGLDDPYYLHRYRPTFWLPEGARRDAALAEHSPRALTQGTRPDFAPDAEVFLFAETRFPEAALRLPLGSGMLVVCDSIGNLRSSAGFSRLLRWLTPAKSFSRPCTIGSDAWLKRQLRPGATLRCDFDRLLALDFDGLLPAHGEVMPSGAKATIRCALDELWPRRAEVSTRQSCSSS